MYPGPLICYEDVDNIVLPSPVNDLSLLCVKNWIVLTQRFDSSLNFNGKWIEYKQGFGVIGANSSFWLGLENMHLLTSSAAYRLRFQLQTWKTGEWFYADYDTITVAAEADKYRWHFGNYSGNAGDGLRFNETRWNLNDMMFTTCGSDNDNQSGRNCGCKYISGWWMNSCYFASLTGQYGTPNYQWCSEGQPAGFGSNCQLKASLMMIQKI